MECRLFWPPIWNRGGNSLSLPCRRSGNVSPFFVHSGMDGRKRLSEDGFQGCERPWMGGRKATFESVKGHVWERERPWAGARGAVPATARRCQRHPKATRRARRAVVFSYDFQLFPRPGNRPPSPSHASRHRRADGRTAAGRGGKHCTKRPECAQRVALCAFLHAFICLTSKKLVILQPFGSFEFR